MSLLDLSDNFYFYLFVSTIINIVLIVYFSISIKKFETTVCLIILVIQLIFFKMIEIQVNKESLKIFGIDYSMNAENTIFKRVYIKKKELSFEGVFLIPSEKNIQFIEIGKANCSGLNYRECIGKLAKNKNILKEYIKDTQIN